VVLIILPSSDKCEPSKAKIAQYYGGINWNNYGIIFSTVGIHGII
jgi:hypothetical protein